MLQDLASDYPVLCPGEVVEHAPTGHRTAVYPAALHHAALHGAAMSSALAADTMAEGVAILLSDGFPLLSGCCSPPLESATGDLPALAAMAWLRQMVVSHRPRTPIATDKSGTPMSFADGLNLLVAGGHRASDVMDVVRPGIDGKPRPFPGWTIGEFEYYLRAATAADAHRRADAISAVQLGICAAMSDDGGRENVADLLKELRDVRASEQRAQIRPQPVVPVADPVDPAAE